MHCHLKGLTGHMHWLRFTTDGFLQNWFCPGKLSICRTFCPGEDFYCHIKCLVIKCICPAVIPMKTTFVCLKDYTVKLNDMQNQVYLIFQTSQINLKTASNITPFDPGNTRKIPKIGTHNCKIMSRNFVRRTKNVVGQSVCQLKIFISRPGQPSGIQQAVSHTSLCLQILRAIKLPSEMCAIANAILNVLTSLNCAVYTSQDYSKY